MCDGCERQGGTVFCEHPLPMPHWTQILIGNKRFDLCPECSKLVITYVQSSILMKRIKSDKKNSVDKKEVAKIIKDRKNK